MERAPVHGQRVGWSLRVALLQLNRTNWFEGVLLLALYAILGIEFFYLPAAP